MKPNIFVELKAWWSVYVWNGRVGARWVPEAGSNRARARLSVEDSRLSSDVLPGTVFLETALSASAASAVLS
jgi:hypothetical protein